MESVPVTPCKGHPSKRQSRPCLVENGNQMAEGEFFHWIPTKISNWQRVLQQILGIRIRMYISLLQNWHIFMVFSGAPCILDGSHRLAAVCMLYLVICASNTSSSHQDTKSCCFPLREQVSQGLNRWAQIGMKTPQILGDLVTWQGEMCFCCNRKHLVNRWISERWFHPFPQLRKTSNRWANRNTPQLAWTKGPFIKVFCTSSGLKQSPQAHHPHVNDHATSSWVLYNPSFKAGWS